MAERMLSSYPEPKIRFECGTCSRRVQYDVQAMLRAGGDRELGYLLDQVKHRMNCGNFPSNYREGRHCRMHFADLARIVLHGSGYAKSKGG